jgi:FSR family fosmidomycin resistance protein-like MFS transporter
LNRQILRSLTRNLRIIYFTFMRQAALIAAVFGLVHALVDACCAITLHHAGPFHHLTPAQSFYLILTYDCIAFGSQPLFGLLADRSKMPLRAALTGVALTALSMVLLNVNTYAAAVLAGCGNALFHIGAGAIVIYLCFGRATLPGIFVAPGALGLAFGIWFGKAGHLLHWPFLIMLLLAFFVIRKLPTPRIPYDEPSRQNNNPVFAAVLLLLLFAVAIRSIGGSLGNGFAPSGPSVAFALAGVAFAGKALGGWIADRLGWIKTCTIALLVSSLMVVFWPHHFPLLLMALFLFQIPMPVTLTAVTVLFPRNPAFAFGLASLALIVGSLPTFYTMPVFLHTPVFFAGLSCVAAIAILSGLKLMRKWIKPV